MTALSASDWLCFAAAPTFAIMALLGAVSGGMDMPCSATPGAPPINGMTLMYLLMSVFHLTPWLKRTAGRRSDFLRNPPQSFRASLTNLHRNGVSVNRKR